jgi:hypothetical protein
VADPAAPQPGDAAPVADVRVIDNGAFQALGMRVAEGHAFDESRPASAAAEMIVTRDLAAQLWPHQSALGRRLTAKIDANISGEIAGVVEPVRLFSPRTPPRPALYLSARRFTSLQRDIVVRAAAEPESLAWSLRSAVVSLDRTLPIYMIVEMRDLVGAALAQDRFVTIVLSAFAAAALLLAAVGVFGLCSADVSLRRREIGVRMALGSSVAGLLVLLLARALARVSVGIAAGGASPSPPAMRCPPSCSACLPSIHPRSRPWPLSP